MVNMPRGQGIQGFDSDYHEPFNELEPAPVFEMLKTWLVARFQA